MADEVTYNDKVSTYVSPNQMEQLRVLSFIDDVQPAELVSEAIEDYLKRRKNVMIAGKFELYRSVLDSRDNLTTGAK